MRRAERGSYSTNLTELRNTWGLQSNPVGYYNLQWAAGFTLNANSWTAEAAPFGSQATDGSLFIDHLGRKWDGDGVFYPRGKWAK